jgi:mono/diheme cytochrome c family protein
MLSAGIAYLQPISAADTAAADPGGTPVEYLKAKSGTPESAEDIKSHPMPPLERAAKSPKGSLKNPYTDDAASIEEGRKLFFNKSCNGCHGGGGGGGMCPPLTNTVWVYGDDDDTLFRLITLGSDNLKKQGYHRKGTESVVGPMPPFGELIDKDQDVMKIIAWIRTKFKGSQERRHW